MRMGPHLVVQSAIVGSLLLGLFGYLAVPGQAGPHLAYSPLVQNALAADLPSEATTKGATNGLSSGTKEAETCAVSVAFPEAVRRWCGLITHYAGINQLAPDLVAALILQESGGDPTAYSRSGAVGLMQVMPRDGLAVRFQCINGPCFANRPTIAELEDPEFNVQFGTRMLAGLVNKHADLREGLRAYGPMDMGYRYADIVLGLWQRYGE